MIKSFAIFIYKIKKSRTFRKSKKWFKFKYEIIYNVYGPGQIKRGSMATVIGIFEELYINKTMSCKTWKSVKKIYAY